MGSSSANWTFVENKLFENALAVFDKDSPEQWENLAKAVGNKTAEEMKLHYQRLVFDIECIEAGLVPLPNYKPYKAVNGRKK